MPQLTARFAIPQITARLPGWNCVFSNLWLLDVVGYDPVIQHVMWFHCCGAVVNHWQHWKKSCEASMKRPAELKQLRLFRVFRPMWRHQTFSLHWCPKWSIRTWVSSQASICMACCRLLRSFRLIYARAHTHTLMEAEKIACVLTSKFPCLESERTCYGEDRGCFCNYTSWLQRGWCRAELWCRLLSNRPDTHVILLHSTRDATWMKQDFCLVVPFCRKWAHKQKSNFEERLCCGSLTGLGSKICQQALHGLPTCSWFRINFPLVTLL